MFDPFKGDFDCEPTDEDLADMEEWLDSRDDISAYLEEMYGDCDDYDFLN